MIISNYVWNRVICRKSILNKYFIDSFPFGPEKALDSSYISFNKLFGVQSLNEYREKIGVYIDYGFGFSWAERDDGFCEVKFCTRWEYPIQAILRTLELSHEAEWFAVEENHTYVSKFYWSNGVREDIRFIEDDTYYNWLWANEDFEESLADSDDPVWYYLQIAEGNWRPWGTNDIFKRYQDRPAYEVVPPLL